jgi:quercetin dioxygenase-like cupin family protein
MSRYNAAGDPFRWAPTTGVNSLKILGWRILATVFVAASAIACVDVPAGETPEVLIEPYNEILLEGSVADRIDDEVAVREILFAPGWKAPKHFHSSDLFIYVIAGEFEVTMDAGERNVYGAGEALRMAANAVRDARNVSSSEPLKLAVFQVGDPHAPFVVPVEQQ